MSTVVAGLTLENVLYEKRGAIAYVTLNRPKVLNALKQAVFAALKSAFEAARHAASIGGVILTASGDKAFAAGADIAEMSNYTGIEAGEATRRAQEVTEIIENLVKRVFAGGDGLR